MLALDSRWRRFTDENYTCPCCGQASTGVYDIGFDHPDSWPHMGLDVIGGDDLEIGEDRLTTDLCKIGDDRYIHCVLPLPIRGSEDVFHFGVWASVSQEDFYAYIESASEGGKAFEGCNGWLMNDLPALGLSEDDVISCVVEASAEDQRPMLTISEGPLKQAQDHGISFDQLLDIYAACGNDLRPHLNG